MNADELRAEYLKLLDEEHNEQVYQSYLEQNTRLIPRDFVQNHGIGCSLVLRKLAFGPDYKSDFFFFSKSSDDWNAVFVEIEKPSSKFFKPNTNSFHPDFQHALDQINDWRAWFNRGNQPGFLQSVDAIHVPKHMAIKNPTYNKFVLVFGRRSEYEGNQVRRSKIQSLERDDFKIVTFDSLQEDLEHKYDVSIGVRHNEYIDVLTDEITSSGLFAWVDPSHLQVGPSLLDKLKNGPKSSMHVTIGNGKLQEAHEYAASKVRVRN